MATAQYLGGRGELDRYDAELAFRQQDMRLLYFRPGAFDAAVVKLDGIESEFEGEIAPIERWQEFLNSYVAGEPLLVRRQLRPMRHVEAGVWELKTLDVRMFGWFSAIDCYICCDVDLATRVKQHRLYAGYRDAAVRFRDALDLDPPKFIAGDDPRGVVSSVNYP